MYPTSDRVDGLVHELLGRVVNEQVYRPAPDAVGGVRVVDDAGAAVHLDVQDEVAWGRCYVNRMSMMKDAHVAKKTCKCEHECHLCAP